EDRGSATTTEKVYSAGPSKDRAKPASRADGQRPPGDHLFFGAASWAAGGCADSMTVMSRDSPAASDSSAIGQKFSPKASRLDPRAFFCSSAISDWNCSRVTFKR